ncbi:MAG: hypothetical protein WC894_06090 [Patescibacteria group bacterium]
MEEQVIKIKKSKRKIVLIVIIIIVLILIAFSYTYFGRTLKQKLQGKYIHENYTCLFKGETVYFETTYEAGVADGFEGMKLFDKNHHEIDSGTSGGFAGINEWKNNLGFDGTNCKKD